MLTPSTACADTSPVADTEATGNSSPNDIGGRVRHPGGFFSSTACAASSMAGHVGEPQGSPVPMSRSATPHVPATPLAAGFGFDTEDIGVAHHG